MGESITIGSFSIATGSLPTQLLGALAVLGVFVAITFGLEAYLGVRQRNAQTHVARMSPVRWHERSAMLRAHINAWAQNSKNPLVELVLDRIGRARKRRINDQVIAELPHMIDVITLSVAAGLPFDAALASYTEVQAGILAEHFKLALQYWQTGLKLRAEALDDIVTELESRELARFVSALKQSLVLGTALVYVLEAQGSEARDAHKQHIETKIAKTPVKMLMPMATCVIPSLLLLLLGPVVIDVMRGLGTSL